MKTFLGTIVGLFIGYFIGIYLVLAMMTDKKGVDFVQHSADYLNGIINE